MASETVQQRSVSPDSYIEKQISRTGKQVKIVDLISEMMFISTGALAYLLLVAVVDHWVVSLGVIGRWFALLLLLGGVGYRVWRSVVPLVLRRINPSYAALTIERSYPALKNSLINFLLLRRERVVHESVFEVIEQKAARDLTDNSADAAVDRTRLITLGYVLAGVFAVFAIYAVASPKSSLQSVQRVVMPWAAIDRPARFTIKTVEPGDVTTFQGATIDISAIIEGPDDPEVTLIYRTDDGQIVDRRVPMTLSESKLRHRCRLPVGEESDGLQQSLSYRIVVGDAISPEYHIRVEPAPTIVVERLDLSYPDYTKRPPRSITGGGDISALEGTKVVVHGKANFPIRSAHLDLNPGSPDGVPLSMKAGQQQAQREIVLQLKPDRRTPLYQQYRLRFTTQNGHQSQNEITHTIDVTRDLAPEVEILTPQQDHAEVLETGQQLIEIRALDPDFATQRVRLRAVSGNTDLLDKVLVEGPREGQVVARYQFRPRQLGLKPGDRVSYRAIAEDNRVGVNGTPNPNISRTRNFTITVVKDPNAEPEPVDNGSENVDDPGNKLEGVPPENAAKKQPQQQPSQRQDGKQPNDPRQSQQKNEGKQPQKGEQQKGEQQKGEQQKDEQQKGEQQKGEQQRGEQQKGEQQKNAGQKTGDGAQQNEREAGSQQQGEGKQGQGGASGKQADQQGNQGAAGQDGTGDANQSGQRRPGDPSGQGGPGSEVNDHDGEVFDRILEKMRRDQQEQNQNRPDGQKDGTQQGGDKKDGTQQGGDKKDGTQQGGDKKDGTQQGGDKKDGTQQGGDKKDGTQQGGDKKDGTQQGGDKKDGTQQGGDKKDGTQQGGDKKDGTQQGGDKKDGTQQGGDKKDGTQQGGDKKDGTQQGGDKKDGTQQGGDKKDGTQQGGDKKDGTQQGGDKKDGTQQGGDKKDGTQQGGDKKDGTQQGGDKKDGTQQGGDKKDGTQQGGDKKDGTQQGGDEKDGTQQGGDEKDGTQQGGDEKDGTQQGGDEKDGTQQGGDKKDGTQQGGDKKDGTQQGGDKKDGTQQGGDKKDGTQQGGDKKDGTQQGGDKKDGTQPDQGKQKAGNKKAGQKKGGGEEQTPGNDKKTSNSESASNGDRSGQGEKGSGQQGKREGNDTAGSSSAGDEGANASSQKGAGEDSKKAGDQKKAAGKTGKQGRDKGQGSQKRPGQQGQDAGGKSPGSPDAGKKDSRQAKKGSSPRGGDATNDGGGIPADAPLDELGLPKEIPDTENARLEYSKLATSKVLEYLKHNQGNQQALKDINLTPEDARRMIKHYDKMRKPQGTSDDSALNDELRSLGLRPPEIRGVRRTKVDRDQRGGLGDDGGQIRPPKGVIDSELFDAFIRGAARGEKK